IHQLQGRESKDIIKFRNHTFLTNTPILINVYGIHHSQKYWKNPEEFIPERFENEHDQHAFFTFGGGSRACLGINFSLIEQR
ncbi:12883_t:CDS:2, partial [Funneliformis mosseae]